MGRFAELPYALVSVGDTPCQAGFWPSYSGKSRAGISASLWD